MADTTLFLVNSLESYIKRSSNTFKENVHKIIEKNFDNEYYYPLFINNLELYKAIIMNNKLDDSVWKTLNKFLNNNYTELSELLTKEFEKIKIEKLIREERIKKDEANIEAIKKEIDEKNKEVQLNVEKDKKAALEEENSDEIDENIENDNKNEIKLQFKNEYSKNNKDILNECANLGIQISALEKKIKGYKKEVRKIKYNLILSNINLLKFKILHLCTILLINDLYNKSDNENDGNSKNDQINNIRELFTELINICEKRKEKIEINYISFYKSFVIKLVSHINRYGYKDINKSFLSHLIEIFTKNDQFYDSSKENISKIISYTEAFKNHPDLFLCKNAFSLLKNANQNNIVRSRENSFDENDPIFNNNNNNKNLIKKNKKIDEYFKKEGEDLSRKFSNSITFKHKESNINNLTFGNNFIENINPNLNNYYSSSFSNKNQYSNLFSFAGNNSFNLNDDSLSVNSSDKLNHTSCFNCSLQNSNLYSGINSRLAANNPYQERIKGKKKKTYDFLDNICGKLGKGIINKQLKPEKKRKDSAIEDFFNVDKKEESSPDIQRNKTTASDNKKFNKKNSITDKNISSKFKDKKNADILALKTPDKSANFSQLNTEEKRKDESIDKIEKTNITKNLNYLFRQTTADNTNI